jgi:hypothetical protein
MIENSIRLLDAYAPSTQKKFVVVKKNCSCQKKFACIDNLCAFVHFMKKQYFFGSCKQDKTCFTKILIFSIKFIFLHSPNDKSVFHGKSLYTRSM